MKQAITKNLAALCAMLFVSLWGVFPACAGDPGYCAWSSGIITLRDSESTVATLPNLGGCVLKYVLIKPAKASDCSSIYAEYKKEKKSVHLQVPNHKTTTVCGSASADAEYKFAGSLYYSPMLAKFTCRSATCTFRYGLAWYE